MTGPQLKALQSAYNAAKKSDDPRVFISRHAVGLNEREQRLKWASLKMGKVVLSFVTLTMKEAEYLIDYLNDNDTKLDIKLQFEFERLKVRDQAAYFDAFCKPQHRYSANQWSFGGRSINELNRIDKIKLIEILSNREPAKGQKETP